MPAELYRLSTEVISSVNSADVRVSYRKAKTPESQVSGLRCQDRNMDLLS